MSVKDRIIIVTGGASGIGHAIAEHLAREGAAVVIADSKEAHTRADALSAQGLRVIGMTVDVANEAQVMAMIADTEAQLGRVDVLVNNAGIYSSLEPKPFDTLTTAEWRHVLDVNVVGLFMCCKAATPAFKRAGGGRIINISSGVAFKGNPLMAHYVASKGAVISLTRALATELGAHNVLVNSVAPGFTLSEGVDSNPVLIEGVRTPSLKNRVLARDMYPEDLVGAVAFFAGDGSRFITGQTLVVDGGAYYH